MKNKEASEREGDVWIRCFLQDGSRENISKRKKLYDAFTDLEKAYHRVDWLALWDVLKIYGVGGKLLSAIKSFYEKASACVKISGGTVLCKL